jgi:Poly-adenylate binding protein, unique domain
MLLLPLPKADANQLDVIQNPDDKKQFVGNAVYPEIEAAFGHDVAGKITGMLLDENAVNFK